MSFFSDQEQFIGRVAANPSAVTKRARWTTRGNRYLRTSGGLRAGHLVVVDPRLQQTLLRLMDRAAPALAEGINLYLVPMAQDAFDAWPVKTGLSKSLLALQFGVEDSGFTFRASLVNTAPYAAFINRGATVRELVWEPADEAARKIAEHAAEELAR